MDGVGARVHWEGAGEKSKKKNRMSECPKSSAKNNIKRELENVNNKPNNAGNKVSLNTYEIVSN